MIGDWVLLDRNYPVLFKSPVKITWNDLDRIRYGRGCVLPIPLTDEILEKNGFVKIDSERYELVGVNSKGKEYHIQVYLIMKCFSINNITDKNNACVNGKPYCHELQNTLRLCGLNDLADNFQI